jgi:hypothetical protein
MASCNSGMLGAWNLNELISQVQPELRVPRRVARMMPADRPGSLCHPRLAGTVGGRALKQHPGRAGGGGFRFDCGRNRLLARRDELVALSAVSRYRRHIALLLYISNLDISREGQTGANCTACHQR